MLTDSLSVFIFLILGSTHYFKYNKRALHYLNTYANDNNFIKWIALIAFINYNERSNAAKIVIIFVFLYEIYFLFAHFYFKCNLKNPE